MMFTHPAFSLKMAVGELLIYWSTSTLATVYFDEYESDVLVLHMFVPHGVLDRIFLNTHQ